MRTKFILSLCLIGSCLMLNQPATADTYSIEQAVDYTLTHNLDLMAAQGQTRAAAHPAALSRRQIARGPARRRGQRTGDPIAGGADTRRGGLPYPPGISRS